MKKLFLIAMVLLLALGASPAMAAETPELTVWVPVYQFGDGTPDQEFWDEKFDTFEAEHNCVVHVEILPWADYNTTIYTGLLNNDGPDVSYVTDTYDLIQAGMLLPLDAYFTQEEKDNYIFWDKGAQDLEGNHYVAPMNCAPIVMFYNKDILEAAGVELPTTWEEFQAACQTIKETTPEYRAFSQNWGASTGTSALMTGFWPYFFQAGGEILDAEGNLTINSEAGVAALEFIKSFSDNGIFDDSIVAEAESVTYFINGELAFLAVGAGESSKFPDVNWGYTMSLQGPAGLGTRTAYDNFAASAKTEYPELAAEAVKFCTSAFVMDDFHEQLYALPPVTADAKFIGNEVFQPLYEDPALIPYQIAVSEFEGKSSFEDTLKSNIHLMLMGELTAQEVLDETMLYYEEQIKQ